jgi:hypothetical protein
MGMPTLIHAFSKNLTFVYEGLERRWEVKKESWIGDRQKLPSPGGRKEEISSGTAG